MAVVKKKVGATVPSPVKTISEKTVWTLPTEKSIPASRIEDFIQLIYGDKKIGKTSLIAQYGDVLFLMGEPGGKALSIYQRPVLSWEAFVKYVDLLEKDKKFRMVAIDNPGNIYKLCTHHMCAKLGIDHPSDEEWGKGWAAVGDEFTHQIMRLTLSGKGVAFIAHATEKEIKSRAGGKFDRIVPALGGQPRDLLEGIVDILAYYTYDGDRRVLIVEGNDLVSAGYRLGVEKEHFIALNGEKVVEIPMGNSPKEAYGNFIAAFENRQASAKGVPENLKMPVASTGAVKKFTVKRR